MGSTRFGLLYRDAEPVGADVCVVAGRRWRPRGEEKSGLCDGYSRGLGLEVEQEL